MATDNLFHFVDDPQQQLPHFPYCQPVSVKVCTPKCSTKTFRLSVYDVLRYVGIAMMQCSIKLDKVVKDQLIMPILGMKYTTKEYIWQLRPSEDHDVILAMTVSPLERSSLYVWTLSNNIRFLCFNLIFVCLVGLVQYSRLKNDCPYIPTVWKPLDVSIGITTLSLPRNDKKDIDTASWILPMELCQSDVLDKLDGGMNEEQCRNCIREVLLGTLKKKLDVCAPIVMCYIMVSNFLHTHTFQHLNMLIPMVLPTEM
jgi:hypothetical protein